MTPTSTSFTETDIRELIETRRDFHTHPELAYEEVRTSGKVAERLTALGLEVRTGVGKTGVVAVVKGGKPGKTVMLRADMDALPIQEANEVPYRSKNDGKMHACGHDCHTSILLGVSKALVRDSGTLPGKVKLCFQPAEEGGAGADAMIRDGVLENPRPDAAFGVHVWQDLDLGKVGITTGPFMAAVDEFSVTVTGKGAHAAMPHFGVDPIVCLAHITTALQSIASRNVSPFAEAVVSVTQIHAGTAFNIIPESGRMNGTVRTFDPEVRERVEQRFRSIVSGVADSLGCRAHIEFDHQHRATVNDPAMAEIARAAAAEVVGADNIVTGIRTMGGEDFSSFAAQVPACFIAVGSRNEARGLIHEHHHPRFDVDEGCLEIGAEIMLRCARKFLGA